MCHNRRQTNGGVVHSSSVLLEWGTSTPSRCTPLKQIVKPVPPTNLLGGRNGKTSALRVHSSLNLPAGQSAPPNEQNGWGRICELTWRALVWGKGAPQIPPLRYATVGMTNLSGGTGLKASAHRVHSMLNLPTGESAAPNEQNAGAGFVNSHVGPRFGGKAHSRSLYFATLRSG